MHGRGYLLKGYHDIQVVDFLEYGWPADFAADSPRVPSVTNHQNDHDDTKCIEAYIKKELEYGAMLGPFSAPPFKPWTQISPMMTHPKRGTAARQVIVELSYPPGANCPLCIVRYT